MARAKSKQTVVEQQHAKLLKKRNVKVADWEEEIKKKAVGDLAFGDGDPEFVEHVLDYYRADELNEEIETYLESEVGDSPKGTKTKTEKTTDPDSSSAESTEMNY